MRTHALFLLSVILGSIGISVAALFFMNVVEWADAELIGYIMLFGSLSALGLVASLQLRAVATNLALVRDRIKRLADGTTRNTIRTDEIHRELIFGSYAHMPGQIARIEGVLGATDRELHRTLATNLRRHG